MREGGIRVVGCVHCSAILLLAVPTTDGSEFNYIIETPTVGNKSAKR